MTKIGACGHSELKNAAQSRSPSSHAAWCSRRARDDPTIDFRSLNPGFCRDAIIFTRDSDAGISRKPKGALLDWGEAFSMDLAGAM